MDRKEVYLYRKLILLSRKQLASIDERLSSNGSVKWNELLFKFRHARIKKILTGMLSRREAAAGEEAVLELIEDFKSIAANGEEWQDAEEKETDYLRFILHGIKAAPVDDAEKVEDM